MKIFIRSLCMTLLAGSCWFQLGAQSLAGTWRFALDPNNEGIEKQWFNKELQEVITLPGSCEQGGFGVKATDATIGKLTRVVRYEGKAWYQREIEVPRKWVGQRMELFLERCHWESNVWIDGKPFGMQNTLSAPHRYDLGSLAEGRHTLTICIDNTYKIPIGTWAHAITEDTQGNWNGIIGRIELHATDPVWIRNVQVFADHLQIRVGNSTGKTVSAKVQHTSCSIPAGGTTVRVPFRPDPAVWDEFTPNMHRVTVSLKAGKYSDQQHVTYATRQLGTKDKQFTINGKPFLMRGPVDECVYPLTGYPPMDKAAWIRILSICKDYGFNYMRFHSWCPPEAAFEAADELGFFFQVEIPLWTMDAPHFGQHAERDQFITDELDRILEAYGNHPSFALMAMGNESAGTLDKLVHKSREADPRRLYRCENGDTPQHGDFFETGQRGIAGPRTDWDRWDAGGWIAGIGGDGVDRATGAPVPTLSHEVGQWAMYPDFAEIDKYTGTLRAYNYEGYRRSLTARGMLDQNRAFAQASGKFSVLLYKEEIEASLRTFPHGGFQILEARDYPGQGTAIVGWLDAFWDSKGLITPEAFRRFCGPTVVLARMPKRVYTNDEDLEAIAELSHYGPKDLNVKLTWELTDDQGSLLASQTSDEMTAKTGRITTLGTVRTSLKKIDAPTRLILTLHAGNVSNSWNLWVYPTRQPSVPSGVTVAYRYDAKTREALARGEHVLLFSDPTQGLYKINRVMLGPDEIRNFPVKPGQNALEGTFMPTFWNLRLFHQVGTLGILCDPTHPALKSFPTEAHSDWQWADLLGRFSAAESFRTAGAPASYCDDREREWCDVRNRSKAIVLNDTPDDYRPIVQVIDNYERNYKLGVIFETRVGAGKLLVCAMDLDTEAGSRPAARQLKSSLLDYAASDAFHPTAELSSDLLERILTFGEQ